MVSVENLIQLVPEHLRTDLLAIIPDESGNELDHPLNAHVKDYEQIVEWCKPRTNTNRQKVLQLGVSNKSEQPLGAWPH